jgi:hypothetical protein
VKKLLFLLFLLPFTFQMKAQPLNCTFAKPFITIHFGSGTVRDLNTTLPSNYGRVTSSCPTDGHYTYTSYTSDCFQGDWFTLAEDHTPEDVRGNMLLVNASWNTGPFLSTTIKSLKKNTTYELALWLMNVCRISDKCPFPLLPNITIRLQSTTGKTVAQFSTGELKRGQVPMWKQYKALFTTPPSETTYILTMINNTPGGCGNDFALDDITFRECIKEEPVLLRVLKPTVVVKKQTPVTRPILKKELSTPAKTQTSVSQPTKQKAQKLPAPIPGTPVPKPKTLVFTIQPPELATRANPIIKQIETEEGEIKIDLYDNGEIDGDSVSIYHNHILLISHAKLSEKPITLNIAIDAAHPHHEIIMVADNLGSIPPNTSLMIVTTGTKKYQVFIASTQQQNAKVVFDLKEK